MPETVTRHEYDDAGRLVASVTTSEPEYTELDFAELQALEIYEASLCPGCGRPVDICASDFDSDRAFVVDSHICTSKRAIAVQGRLDAWENDKADKRGDMPIDAHWDDGLMYLPRHARDDELE